MSSAPINHSALPHPMNGLEPIEARQIFINDISGDTTTSDLRNLFAAAGKVTNVEIDTNELNRHFAFVTFESSQGVQTAITELTTTNLNNTTLVCRRRTELEQMRQKRMIDARCKLFVGNIPQQMSPNDLRREIERLSGRSIADFRHKKGYCFVGYSSPQDAEDAKRNLKNAMCGGKSLNAEFKKEDPIRNEPGFIAVLEQAQRTLYVRDIPSNSNPDSFKQIFEQYGKVRKFTLPTENRSNKMIGYAFIEYFWKKDCDKALLQSQALLIDGVSVEIRISDPPKDKQSRSDREHRGRGSHRRDYRGRDDGRRSMNRDRREMYNGGRRDMRGGSDTHRRSRFSRNRSRSRSRSRSRDRNTRYNHYNDSRHNGHHNSMRSTRDAYPTITHNNGLTANYNHRNPMMYGHQHNTMPPNPYNVPPNAPARYAPYNAAPPPAANAYNNRAAVTTSYNPYHAPTQTMNNAAQQQQLNTAPNNATAPTATTHNPPNPMYAGYGTYNVSYGYPPNPYGMPQTQAQPNATATTAVKTQQTKTETQPQQPYVYPQVQQTATKVEPQPQPPQAQTTTQNNVSQPQAAAPYYYNTMQPNAYVTYYQQQTTAQPPTAAPPAPAANGTKTAPQQPQQYPYPQQQNYPYNNNRRY
eukprot:230818_1